MRFRLLVCSFIVGGILFAGLSASPLAQDSTPEAATPVAADDGAQGSDGISLHAGSLENPRGMTWAADGTLIVALAGSGGTTMDQRDSPQNEQYGPYFRGDTASVVSISLEGGSAIGCPVPVAGGLPSTRGMGGHVQGPAAVAFLDDQLYVLQDGGSAEADAFPDKPNGVYAVNSDGSVTLVADIKKWHDENPVANVPYDLTEESETFAMLPGDGFLWVLESNSGQVLQMTPDGEITRIADLSEGHPVPTGFTLSPGGGVYVAFLTPAPYTDGTSKVVNVAPDGIVTDVWTGLTTVTGLATDDENNIYALEMASGNIDEPPYTQPNTGRIVRQTGADTLEEVVTGLDYPIAMAMGPDGALYVSTPAFGADDLPGGILRVDLSADTPIAVSPDILSQSSCDIATPVPATPGAGTPMPMPMASPEPVQTSAADAANDGGKPATGAQAVQIQNFAFSPATLTIPVGTTVTWTNLDGVTHTATADDGTFDSGNLSTNQSFSFRFDKAGTYTYHCSIHPNMTATITVVEQ